MVWGRFGGMVVGVVGGGWFWWNWWCFWRMEFSPQPITFMTMQPSKIEIARTIKMMPWTAREPCWCGNLRSKIFLQIPQQNMLPKDYGRKSKPNNMFSVNAVLTQIQFCQIWSQILKEDKYFWPQHQYFLLEGEKTRHRVIACFLEGVGRGGGGNYLPRKIGFCDVVTTDVTTTGQAIIQVIDITIRFKYHHCWQCLASQKNVQEKKGWFSPEVFFCCCQKA